MPLTLPKFPSDGLTLPNPVIADNSGVDIATSGLSQVDYGA